MVPGFKKSSYQSILTVLQAFGSLSGREPFENVASLNWSGTLNAASAGLQTPQTVFGHRIRNVDVNLIDEGQRCFI